MTIQDRLLQMLRERGTLTTSDIAAEFNGSNGLICSSPMEQFRKLRARLHAAGGAIIRQEKVKGRSIYRYTYEPQSKCRSCGEPGYSRACPACREEAEYDDPRNEEVQ